MARRISGFAAVAAVPLAATAAIGAAVLAPAGAQETDTANLEVSASVPQLCSIESVGSIDFGDLALGQQKDAQTTITFVCTFADSGVTVDINFGANSSETTRHMSNSTGTSLIEYLICEDSECNDLWTEPVDHPITGVENDPLPVYARVPAASIGPDVLADDYSDTLVVTLQY